MHKNELLHSAMEGLCIPYFIWLSAGATFQGLIRENGADLFLTAETFALSCFQITLDIR
jgi:hypothetical protein